MNGRRWGWIAAAVGLSGVSALGLRPTGSGGAMPAHPAPPDGMTSLTAPQTPSARARREAMNEWWRAQDAVNSQREAMEAWDSAAARDQADQEPWRRQLIAGSRRHELQGAAAAAARAQALARTPGERFAASELAWRIAADSGNRGAELAAAQLLVRLDPRHPVSRLALPHAARSWRSSSNSTGFVR